MCVCAVQFCTYVCMYILIFLLLTQALLETLWWSTWCSDSPRCTQWPTCTFSTLLLLTSASWLAYLFLLSLWPWPNGPLGPSCVRSTTQPPPSTRSPAPSSSLFYQEWRWFFSNNKNSINNFKIFEWTFTQRDKTQIYCKAGTSFLYIEMVNFGYCDNSWRK